MIKRTTSNQNFGGNLSQGLFRHVFFTIARRCQIRTLKKIPEKRGPLKVE